MPALSTDGLTLHELATRAGILDHHDAGGAAPTDGDILTWVDANARAEFKTPGGGSAHALGSATHTDVSLTSIAAYDLVYRNAGNTAWVNLPKGTDTHVLTMVGGAIAWAAAAGGSAAPVDADYLVRTANATLTAERVVTNTTSVEWDWATAGQAKAVVQFAGTGSSGVAARSDHLHDDRYAQLGHAHAADDITSGTFADARIAASNVTQHQAVLALSASQVGGANDAARTFGSSGQYRFTGDLMANRVLVPSLASATVRGHLAGTGFHETLILTNNLAYSGANDPFAAANWLYIQDAGANNRAGSVLVVRGNSAEAGAEFRWSTAPTSTGAGQVPASLTTRFRVLGTGFADIPGTLSLGAGNRATAGELRLPRAGTVQWRNEANGANLNVLSVNASDQLVLGVSVATQVRVVGGTYQFRGASTLADATDKNLRVVCDHFTTAEEPFGIYLNAPVSGNIINVGGGSSALNAATIVRVYTATDTTTTTGTERLRVTPNGRLLVGLTADSGALFQVNGDVTIASLGTFDSAAAPVAGNLLRYNGTKWAPAGGVQVFVAGDVASAAFTDGTAGAFVHDGRTLSGTPSAPGTAPALTAGYRSIVVDMSAISGGLPGTQAWVVQWSTDAGSTWSDAGGDEIVTTGAKVVHTRLLIDGTTYRYRVRRRGATTSAASPSTADLAPSTTPDITTATVILASQIATANLSALSANLGVIDAGQMRNAANTAGVLVSGALPGTWTRYLDLTGDSGDSMLHHDQMDLKYDGTAVFRGALDLTNPELVAGSEFSGEDLHHVFLRAATAWGVDHGMTNLVPTDVAGTIGIPYTNISVTEGAGGLALTGYATLEARGLHLWGIVDGAGPAVVVLGSRKSGTGHQAMGAGEVVLAVEASIGEEPPQFEVLGDGARALHRMLIHGNANPHLGLHDGTVQSYLETVSGALRIYHNGSERVAFPAGAQRSVFSGELQAAAYHSADNTAGVTSSVQIDDFAGASGEILVSTVTLNFKNGLFVGVS
jgi:hypothetical protein